MLSDGSLFAERYRIVRLIASGGMGAVYETVHQVTGRRVALKVMLGHTLSSEALRSRFLQEARVAGTIRSRHIVDVLDAGVDSATNAPFLVMELLEGEDVGQRLQRLGRLDRAEAALLLWQTAVALDKLHRRGIVHRDLKPRNLFVARTEDGKPSVKLLDFGVAKMLAQPSTSESATQNVGTPLYMAPEQFDPKGKVSAATDLYAFGLLAYTLLVGEHYFKDEHALADNPFAFAVLVSGGPEEPASVRAELLGVRLPRAFDEWFKKATSRDPARRFSSCMQAVTALALALGTSVPAPPLEDDSGANSSSVPPGAEVAATGAAESDWGRAKDDQPPTLDARAEATAVAVPHASCTSDRLEATSTSLSITNGEARRQRRSRRLLVAAGVGVLVAGSFGLFALRSRSGSADAPAPAAADRVVAIAPDASAVLAAPEDVPAVPPSAAIPSAASAARVATDVPPPAHRPPPARKPVSRTHLYKRE